VLWTVAISAAIIFNCLGKMEEEAGTIRLIKMLYAKRCSCRLIDRPANNTAEMCHQYQYLPITVLAIPLLLLNKYGSTQFF